MKNENSEYILELISLTYWENDIKECIVKVKREIFGMYRPTLINAGEVAVYQTPYTEHFFLPHQLSCTVDCDYTHPYKLKSIFQIILDNFVYKMEELQVKPGNLAIREVEYFVDRVKMKNTAYVWTDIYIPEIENT